MSEPPYSYYYSPRFYDDADCVEEIGRRTAQMAQTTHNSGDSGVAEHDPALYEYRYIVPLDKKFRDRYYALGKAPGLTLLTEKECESVGIVQSRGWQHVAFFDGLQTLVFRRERRDSAA